MPLLLLLATLAEAHAGHDEPPPPMPVETQEPAPSSGAGARLAIEGTLRRLGLPMSAAVRVSAAWREAIEAPDRSYREGRAEGWDFGDRSVSVQHQRLSDGQVLVDVQGQSPHRGAPDLCAVIGNTPGKPVRLAPMDPRGRNIGPADMARRQQELAVVWVDEPDQRTALTEVGVGESVTVVELVPDANTPSRRRAQDTRQVRIRRRHADLTLTETDAHTHVCVLPHPPAPTAQVVKQGGAAPTPQAPPPARPPSEAWDRPGAAADPLQDASSDSDPD